MQQIRNIGIIAHIDAGKTTLSERMLFYSRKIHRLGEVHDGTATMDYLPEEQERGITITSACTSCRWNGCEINLIDTPGHVDFTIEVERSLRVLDGAVGVFCAVAGVEPQSETVWRQSERFGVPKLAFINKMDRPGASFERVLEGLRTRLSATPVALTVPWGEGASFTAVLDVLREERLDFDQADQGRTVTRRPWNDEERAFAAPWRDRALETLAEADDLFLDGYLRGACAPEDIAAALRRATLARHITPAFCGSALRNTGVQPLLDAVRDYLPAPEDIPAPVGHDARGNEVVVTSDGPTTALVFKVLMEEGRKLAFLRLYAGSVGEGDSLRNSRTGKEDRVGRLYRMNAGRREQLATAGAGAIVAVIGLRDARTGDTYTAPGGDVRLESIDSYPPVITLALEPRNAGEGKILDEALARYVEEDPTFHAVMDEESATRAISGMGELHLDVLLERLEREYGIRPRVGHPQVTLRETIRKPASASHVFDRELGKERHYGEVALQVAPRPRGSGNTLRLGDFPNASASLPPALVDATLSGVRDALQCGDLTGYPVEDVEIVITGITRREGLTTAPGCHMAAGAALRNALSAASPTALEPVMHVEISVPEDFLGAAIGLFGGCGGKVDGIQERGGLRLISGDAPMRRLFGFSTSLRSATQGRAGLLLRFDRFDG